MKEDFIHQIWNLQLFSKEKGLFTSEGALQVIKPGFKNRNAGPDFEQSRIRLGGMDWNGSVEIHVKASEWNAHGHQYDAAYQSVILHVVWENDESVYRKDGSEVPCLEIKNLVPLSVLLRYRELVEQKNAQFIPCGSFIQKIEPFLMVSMQERVLVERLERKANAILERYYQSGKDWMSALYYTLAWGLGLKINAEEMEMLARSVPLKTAASQNWNPEILAALYLGQADFLDPDFPVQKKLHAEYLHWVAKYNLQKPPIQWKKFRLRPGAFPEQRVLMLVNLVSHLPKLIENLDKNIPIPEWFSSFEKEDHPALFDAFLKEKGMMASHLRLTSFLKNNLTINVLSPFLTAWGLETKNRDKIEKALEGLAQMAPEQNQYIKNWAQLGIVARSASETQALLELEQNYCRQKKCMDCLLGAQIIKGNFKD